MADENRKSSRNDDGNGEARTVDSCQGCEERASLSTMGLCPECSEKLDRDLIRKRDWEYSVTAFGVPKEKLEDLRNQIIKTHGKALELIAEDPPSEKKRTDTRKRKKAKRRKARRKQKE
jgi:hypothetical protein